MTPSSPSAKKPWNWLDTYCTEEIVCPYCRYEHTDSWEFTEDEPAFICGDCGEKFSMERDVTVKYTTRPREDD